MDDEDEIAAYQSGPVQVRKAKPKGWTKARRAAFLTELAHSCNISRAHKAAGMGERGAAFARQWQEALELGYERLEAALLGRALEAVGALEPDKAEEGAQLVEKMTVAQAMDLLNRHRASVQQGRAVRPRQQARQVATQEETDAVLIKRIRMVLRQRAIRAERAGAGALPSPGEHGGPGAPEGPCD